MKHFSISTGLIILFLTVSLFFSAKININDNGADLLPDGKVKKQFMTLKSLGLVNRIFILLSSENKSEQAIKRLEKAVEKSGAMIENNPGFRDVFYRIPPESSKEITEYVLKQYPALFIADDLAFFEKKTRVSEVDKSLRILFSILNSPAGFMLADNMTADPFGLALHKLNSLKQIRGNLKINFKNGFLTNGKNTYLIYAESTLPLTESTGATTINSLLRQIFSASLDDGMSFETVGSLSHTLANEQAIKRDLKLLLPLASLILITIFLLMFRKWISVIAAVVPMLASIPAIAVTSYFYEEVSGLALGFGIVLLGVGVDFAIHLYWASGEREHGAVKNLYKPLVMACVTTMSGFAVLMFSAVSSHRQMALLGITGIFFAALLSWLIVPKLPPPSSLNLAYLQKFRIKIFEGLTAKGLGDIFFRTVDNYRYFIIAFWLFFISAGLFCWPSMKYEGDISKIDIASPKIVSVEQNFRKEWGNDFKTAFMVAEGKDLSTALNINDLIFQNLLYHKVQNIQSTAPFLPGPLKSDENITRWNKTVKLYRRDLIERVTESSEKYGFTKDAFKPFFNWFKQRHEKFDPYEMFQGPLRHMLSPFVKDKRVENDKSLVVTIVPDSNQNRGILKRIEYESENISLISPLGWKKDMEKVLKKDILLLSSIAALVVMCLTCLFFRNIKIAFGAIAPALSALSSISIYSAIAGRSLNIMHLLMAIMVIGLSVDYGIFMASALREKENSTLIPIFPITLCAVSTLSGFGILYFASHPALTSLGSTVIAGVGSAWPTAVLVTPSILKSKNKSN